MTVSVATSTIVKQACRHLEQPEIGSLSETHPTALAMAEQYAPALELSLSMYDWGFARKSVRLPPYTGTDAFADAVLTTAYALPGDLERILHVEKGVSWRREGNLILADKSTGLALRYVRTLSNEAQLPVSFRDVVALQLALRLPHLLESRAKRGDLRDRLGDVTAIAMQVDEASASAHDFTDGETVAYVDWASEATA